jgi:hypothetical protein
MDANFFALKLSIKCCKAKEETSAALGHPSNPMIKCGFFRLGFSK